MYYTIYKITNQIDGKFYIGSHKTKHLDDDYMGSGKYLKRAQEKYGIQNFTKEILFVFDTADEMYAKEKEIINEDFLAVENTYNLKIGGFGGWDFVNSNKDILVSRNTTCSRKRAEKIRADSDYREDVCKNLSMAAKNRKQLSEEHKQKQRQIALDALAVAKEVNKTKMWITNGLENRKISKSNLIPDGWRPGRVGNFVNKKYQNIIP